MTAAIFAAGVISALAIYVLFIKVGIRRVCGYDVAADILATLLLMVMFAGTYTGMIAAVIAGLLLSVMLLATKRLLGYERLTLDNGHLSWKRYSHTGIAQ